MLAVKWGIHTIQFVYDEVGAPLGLKYRTTSMAQGVYNCYFFEKNLQGDIVAIYNSSGTKIATYTYDAWGKVTCTTTSSATTLEKNIANTYNPFRYRGYFYDVETGWYYLQSRSYDPAWGRFVNADGYVSTGTGLLGYNMFAYCNNNPINNVDANGNIPLKAARFLLTYWILGSGYDLYLDDSSLVSKALKKSRTMKKVIKAMIEDGKTYGSGTVTFGRSELDLWLGIRNASYKIEITKQTETKRFLFFKKTKTRYIANVIVFDIYDFNTGNEKGDGIGSILNNIGYWAQENGLGNKYYWEAEYTYETKWK